MSSEVVNGVRAGSVVWIAQAIAASAGITSGPIEIAPCGVRSQSVSGSSNIAVPAPTSISRIPVSLEIGGCGVRPASISPSWSIPDSISIAGSA